MSKLDWISAALTWFVRIAGIIQAYLGKKAATAVVVAQAAGAYSSTSDAVSDAAKAEDSQMLGLAGFAVSFLIPLIFKAIKKFTTGKVIAPGYVAAADQASIETLYLTREGRPGDIAHIDALVDSGVLIEQEARKAAAKSVAVAKPAAQVV
jgi:hypothetical protein